MTVEHIQSFESTPLTKRVASCGPDKHGVRYLYFCLDKKMLRREMQVSGSASTRISWWGRSWTIKHQVIWSFVVLLLAWLAISGRLFLRSCFAAHDCCARRREWWFRISDSKCSGMLVDVSLLWCWTVKWMERRCFAISCCIHVKLCSWLSLKGIHALHLHIQQI